MVVFFDGALILLSWPRICICSVPYEYLAHTRMGNPIRVRVIFRDPYAYGLPVRVRAAHTSIAGNHWFARMRICARIRVWVSYPYAYMSDIAIAIGR